MYYRRLSKGFTLIEMLIVVVIVGILGTALVVRIKGAQERAYDVGVINDIRQIASALSVYRNDMGTVPQRGMMTDEFAAGGAFSLVPTYLSTLPFDRSQRSFEYGIAEDTVYSSGSRLYNTRCNDAPATFNPVYSNVSITSYRMVGKAVPFNLSWSTPQSCTQNFLGYGYVPLPKQYGSPAQGFALVGGVAHSSNANWVNKPWHITIFEQYPSYAGWNPRIYFPYPTHQLLDVINGTYAGKMRGSDILGFGNHNTTTFANALCKKIIIQPGVIISADSYMLLSGDTTAGYDCYVEFKKSLGYTYYYKNEDYQFQHIEVFE